MAGRTSRKRKINGVLLSEIMTGWLFIAPQMIGFIVFVLVPLVSVFYFSLQERNLLFGTVNYVGLDNYVQLATDDMFYKTLFNSLIFSAGIVPLSVGFSLAFAFLLVRRFRGAGVVRSLIFLPVVTSAVAWSIVWKLFLQGGEQGVLNSFLALFGITGPNYLREPGWAMASVIASRVIKNLGLNVLIFMSAIINIPETLLEAARIDGANGWMMLFRIKLPLLMPAFLMVTIVTVIGSLRVFDTIKLMTDGGPEGSTMVLVYYIYHIGFKMFRMGEASAVSVILFFIVLGLTVAQWAVRRKVSYHEEK
ncbi:MAG: sugar ABC transporter permease [Spirochaetales bacterium]|nr:sugar ABC transporter permease [Spirochaetales bacterium]